MLSPQRTRRARRGEEGILTGLTGFTGWGNLARVLIGMSVILCTGATEREGVVPRDANGRELNLGFEEGTLRDWTAVGKAFEGQPVKGDTVARRRADMKSNHAGEYWVGSYERKGDEPQGTLTSVPFKVTQPWGSFLMAGGSQASTRVELVRKGEEKAFLQVSGSETETMRPVVVDLKEQLGKEIFIRLVDEHSGGWGHVNFDDFRFHAQRPKLENEIDPAKAAADAPPPVDAVKFAGLTAEEAAAAASVPEGFSMKLFAGEPNVQQPIAFALDDRGRVWVAEGFTYPRRAPEGQGRDRILILEDTDGDHKFDKRTVFAEKLNLVSGLEVGFGGVFVGAAPYLMFIADRNGDDKADGEPEILLDGWGFHDTHETLNTFAWGPDGWLYGCHGVFTHSNVGKPGAKDAERTKLNGAIWRYHPTKKSFEVFGEGTSNPWGIDFDARGQCVIEACVIPHLFHIIQGGRYQRQAGQHFNPHIYEDIQQVGDHVHWAGNKGPHAANNRSDAAGGGHAHAGLMIYEGGSFPEQFRGKIFMNNIHGQRLNMDIPERQGSGFVGRHGPDFVNFNDTWSQVLNMLYDQDGSVYIIDWYDKNQCHHGNEAGHDRSNGRIFKLVYGDAKVTKIDLQKESDVKLVEYLGHKNEFYARHARRILQERAAHADLGTVHTSLKSMLRNSTSDVHQLRALWTLHVTGGLDEKTAMGLLESSHEFVRAWTIQLLAEGKDVGEEALKKFAGMAANDPSPVVRLYLASAMQRVEPGKRWEVVTALLNHADDAQDHNLPYLYWYAAEGAIAADPQRGVKLLQTAKIPKVRQFIARRVTATNEKVVSAK
jgi:putative membrane-bound dehydrogenase-like protein